MPRGFPGSSADQNHIGYRSRQSGPRTPAEVALVNGPNAYTGLYYVGMAGRGYKTREAAETARQRYMARRFAR